MKTLSEPQLTDTLDLMVDEFKRIQSCPGADDEIKQLCERAMRNTYQHVPVIVQRDNAEKKATRLRTALYQIAHELRQGNKAITDTVWMSVEPNITMLELIEHALEAAK